MYHDHWVMPFGSFYIKWLCVSRKVSQSIYNIFRDSHGNLFFHFTAKTVENYTLYMFKFKLCGKMFEEKYAASIGTKAKQIVLNICDYF